MKNQKVEVTVELYSGEIVTVKTVRDQNGGIALRGPIAQVITIVNVND